MAAQTVSAPQIPKSTVCRAPRETAPEDRSLLGVCPRSLSRSRRAKSPEVIEGGGSRRGRRASARRRGGAGLDEPLLHLCAADETGLLEEEETSLHYDEVGDALNTELRRELRMPLRVHLQDEGPAGHLVRSALDLGSGHLAGSAPGRPEVHEHRDLRFPRDFAKGLRVGLDWPGHRRDLGLARAAAADLVQPFRRGAVLPAAGRTLQDHALSERRNTASHPRQPTTSSSPESRGPA